MNPGQIGWLLLPPEIRDRLHGRLGSDPILPTNLLGPIWRRLLYSPRAEELARISRDIIDHLEADLPGWGPWPADIQDAIGVGVLLGIWIKAQADLIIMELSEHDLAFLEQECDAKGIELEQYLIERLVESKEEGDQGEWWKV
jgi:hypothetical protein